MFCLKTDASFSLCITEGPHQMVPLNLLSTRQDGEKMVVEVVLPQIKVSGTAGVGGGER